jgi:hypothetical protein
VEQVVDHEQRRGQQLVGDEQVVDVGARVSAARVAAGVDLMNQFEP